MAPNLPGRKIVLFLIRAVRFVMTFYLVGASITTLVLSSLMVNVGGIITSIYLIPASLVLAALELGYLRSRTSLLRFEMHPVRVIALQFLSAMMAGAGWPDLITFILGCVAFGVTIGLMNLIGIYYLCWGTVGHEEGSDAWDLDCEKSPGTLFLMPGEEDALLAGSEGPDSARISSSEDSKCSGPEVLSVD